MMRPLAHRRLVEEAEPSVQALAHQFAAEEHVGGRVEVGSHGEVLVDGLYPQRLRVPGRGELHRPALEADFARGRWMQAAERLDAGGLAGAVVAHQGDDLAMAEGEARAAQGLDAAEALHDVARLKEWRSGGGLRHRGAPYQSATEPSARNSSGIQQPSVCEARNPSSISSPRPGPAGRAR